MNRIAVRRRIADHIHMNRNEQVSIILIRDFRPLVQRNEHVRTSRHDHLDRRIPLRYHPVQTFRNVQRDLAFVSFLVPADAPRVIPAVARIDTDGP